jgi:hypothetical protein
MLIVSILVFLILPIFAYRLIQITIRSEHKRLVKNRSSEVGGDTQKTTILSPTIIIILMQCKNVRLEPKIPALKLVAAW